MAIERKRQREGEIERGGKKREKKRERGERKREWTESN